jgi:hypothetical protein
MTNPLNGTSQTNVPHNGNPVGENTTELSLKTVMHLYDEAQAYIGMGDLDSATQVLVSIVNHPGENPGQIFNGLISPYVHLVNEKAEAYSPKLDDEFQKLEGEIRRLDSKIQAYTGSVGGIEPSAGLGDEIAEATTELAGNIQAYTHLVNKIEPNDVLGNEATTALELLERGCKVREAYLQHVGVAYNFLERVYEKEIEGIVGHSTVEAGGRANALSAFDDLDDKEQGRVVALSSEYSGIREKGPDYLQRAANVRHRVKVKEDKPAPTFTASEDVGWGDLEEELSDRFEDFGLQNTNPIAESESLELFPGDDLSMSLGITAEDLEFLDL